jgi:hypothetical protein
MAENLDTLFKRAMAAATRGRNPNVRKKAVQRVRGEVMNYGGYTWTCIGPQKGGCAGGAVIMDNPSPVIGRKGSPGKKRKKVAKKGKAVAAPAKKAKRVGAKKAKSGKKVWTQAERKAFAEKMKRARAAKRKGK